MTLSRPRFRLWMLDAAAVVALVVIAARVQSTGEGPQQGLPFWAQASDPYLWGPDAGEWAMQAQALAQGNYGDLDGHRMPTWTILTVATMRATGLDVALSGHLVNRLMHLALGPVVYGLGRMAGVRGGALAAGIMAVTQPMLAAAAARFGVDPTVAFLVPCTLYTALLAARWWWLAPLAGTVGGLAMVSHLSAFGFAIPGLLLCLLNGQGWWRRWLGAVLYAGAAYLLVTEIFSVFPLLPGRFLLDAYAEGIAPAAGTSPGELASAREGALATLRANAPAAVDTATAYVLASLRPPMVPWALLLALPWLALLGPQPFEPRRAEEAGLPTWRWAVSRGASALAVGVPMACALAPLVAFAAGQAPQRYSDNLLPVAAVLLMRGASALLAPVGALVRRWIPVAVFIMLEAGLLIGWAWSIAPPLIRRPALGAVPKEEARGLAIGRALGEHFPPGTAGACPIREALPYAGMLYCPNTVCPFGESEAAFEECVVILRKECRGDGEVPYVVVDDLTPEQSTAARRAMDAWVAARLPPVATVGSARIYALPAEGPMPAPLVPESPLEPESTPE